MSKSSKFLNCTAISLGALASVAMAGALVGAASADETSSVIRDGKIGYVLTNKYWAVYQTPNGEVECPNGFNSGPREQFKMLFPEESGEKYTLLESHLAREAEVWFPNTDAEPYPFYEAQGDTAIGLNLDGEVSANDFMSPEGDEGIDNQLYRAIGCIANYRGPDGTVYHFDNKFMQQFSVNRMLIEISGVDDLQNDDDVTVTTYRGQDGLLTDATGKDFIPGGTQQVDGKWGDQYVQTFKGKIEDGILTTDAHDLDIAWSATFETNTVQPVKDLRFQLKLTEEKAEGLMGGYVDIKNFQTRLARAWSTHHQSYGQLSSPSLYRAMLKLADAYPDPQTGENTALSGAMQVAFTQAFIMHPEQPVATDGQQRLAAVK